MSALPARRVLFVGWDGADWKIAQPLIDRGEMPNLAGLVARGVHGDLATLEPVLSPMLWTSIGSGMRADRHGILGFIEPDAEGKGIRPSTSYSRTCKALWNLLMHHGLKSTVIGWFCGHPAEPIDGVIVSERFQGAPTGLGRLWPVQPGTVHPERLEETLAELRVHPGEIDEAQLLAFLPKAAERGVDAERDRRIESVCKILADVTSLHAAATWLLEHEPWDLFALYLDGLDHFGHGFMEYHPPRMEHVSEQDFELYAEVMNTAYRYHDLMLGRLLELAGPDVTVVLCSDHGFHSDHLRPRKGEQRTKVVNASWHRRHGMFVAAGPGVREGGRIEGASLLDVTPTVLSLFGLPVGADMAGRPLLAALADSELPEPIPSWENVEGPCGMHPPEAAQDPWEAQEAVQQLVELGYVDALPKRAEEAVRRAQRDRRFNLARVRLDAGRPEDAIEDLRALRQEYPDDFYIACTLADCLQRLGDHAGASALLDGLVAPKAGEEEAAQGAVTGEGDEAGASLLLLRGRQLLVQGKPAEALEAMREAEAKDPRQHRLYLQVGVAHLRLAAWAEAEAALHQALDADPHLAEAHHGLSVAQLRLDRPEEAALSALRAVELDHHLPEAHFQLGVALLGLDRVEAAARALEAAVRLRPGFAEGHQLLAEVYEQALDQPEQAAAHRAQLAASSSP